MCSVLRCVFSPVCESSVVCWLLRWVLSPQCVFNCQVLRWVLSPQVIVQLTPQMCVDSSGECWGPQVCVRVLRSCVESSGVWCESSGVCEVLRCVLTPQVSVDSSGVCWGPQVMCWVLRCVLSPQVCVESSGESNTTPASPPLSHVAYNFSQRHFTRKSRPPSSLIGQKPAGDAETPSSIGSGCRQSEARRGFAAGRQVKLAPRGKQEPMKVSSVELCVKTSR